MVESPQEPRLAPGSDGVPLLGETLSFAKNPFRFLEDRLALHGRIFRTRVLGRKTVVVAGPEVAGRFIDPALIVREGSMPPHVEELFGGRSLPLLDGEAHRARKALVIQAFTRTALQAYTPVMQRRVEQSLAGAPAAGEFRWLDEMQRLAIEIICSNVIGIAPGEELDRLRRDYGLVTDGFATLPINLPGTRYRKALAARDRILVVLRRVVRERRAAPTDDGLSRILAAVASAGTPLADEDAALELHHIVIAGYIVYALLGGMVRQLTLHADVRSKLSAEIAAVAPSGALTPETLMALPYLLQVVNEVKRVTAVVPVVFGKARRDFELDGRAVPAGWMVLWAILPSHVGQSLYTDPETFDPDRFSPARAEDHRHQHAFAPQGAGPVSGHRCPGLDYATYLMEIFTVVLLRDYTWQLPPQSFELLGSKTPPEPKDGLRASVTRQARV